MDAAKVNPERALASRYNPAHYFAYVSAAYFFLLSLPLLLFPRILLLISTPRGAAGQAGDTPDQGASAGAGVSALGPELTPIERQLAYSWGIAQITLGLVSLVLTGAIPLTSHPLPDQAASGQQSPYRQPSVLLLTLYYLAIAAQSYLSVGKAPSAAEAATPSELGTGNFGLLLALPHAGLAAWGLFVLMFGGDMAKNKKKAGDASAKDKATSNFPFKNTYAENEKSK